MIKTPWRVFVQDEVKHRIRARYGLDYDFAERNHQAPYFSITSETERLNGTRWQEDSCGMDPNPIAQHFPELSKYTKWHLTGTEGPMHYLPNAIYWWEYVTGARQDPSTDPQKAFQSTIVFGALADDDRWPYATASKQDVIQRLKERLYRLLAAWRADMQALGVLEEEKRKEKKRK